MPGIKTWQKCRFWVPMTVIETEPTCRNQIAIYQFSAPALWDAASPGSKAVRISAAAFGEIGERLYICTRLEQG